MTNYVNIAIVGDALYAYRHELPQKSKILRHFTGSHIVSSFCKQNHTSCDRHIFDDEGSPYRMTEYVNIAIVGDALYAYRHEST